MLVNHCTVVELIITLVKPVTGKTSEAYGTLTKHVPCQYGCLTFGCFY